MPKHTSPQESAPTLEVAKLLFPQTREQVLALFPEREGFTVVDKALPFPDRLKDFVFLHNVDLSAACQPFTAAYRGWDFNRRGDNLMTSPEFGTGFEGYGVGRYDRGEDMIVEIAQRGKKEIEYIRRFYPDTARIILGEIRDALAGVRTTSRALEMLQAIWIGNLRGWQQAIKGNRVAESFRDNTKVTVSAAPRVGFYYDPKKKVIRSVHYRPLARRGLAGVQINRCSANPEKLLKADPDLLAGWKLMSQIGMMGHPAVRALEPYGFLRGHIADAVAANDGWR